MVTINTRALDKAKLDAITNAYGGATLASVVVAGAVAYFLKAGFKRAIAAALAAGAGAGAYGGYVLYEIVKKD